MRNAISAKGGSACGMKSFSAIYFPRYARKKNCGKY